MCGILAALLLAGDTEANRRRVLKASKKQRHRGPDATSIYVTAAGDSFIAFERLNIMDVTDAGR
jgi:asparagine synthase (glutamine-hydrolysing)